MKKLSIVLAALVAAAFALPALAVDSSSPKDDKSTHKDAVEKKEQSNAGTGATGETKTSKKSKKAKKMKSNTNAGSGSTTTPTAGDPKSGAADNKATSGTSSPAKP